MVVVYKWRVSPGLAAVTYNFCDRTAFDPELLRTLYVNVLLLPPDAGEIITICSFFRFLLIENKGARSQEETHTHTLACGVSRHEWRKHGLFMGSVINVSGHVFTV